MHPLYWQLVAYTANSFKYRFSLHKGVKEEDRPYVGGNDYIQGGCEKGSLSKSNGYGRVVSVYFTCTNRRFGENNEKMIRGLISATVVGFLTLGTAVSANAAELRLWENDHYSGPSIAFSYCNADFRNNIYDSGKQNIEQWVTIWNNTIFSGDVAIARLYKNTNNGAVPVFDATNAADHATCFG